MSQSVFGFCYNNTDGVAEGTSLVTTGYTPLTVVAADSTVNNNLVTDNNMRFRNTSGQTLTIDGVIVFSALAPVTAQDILFTVGTSTDDSTYTEDTNFVTRVNVSATREKEVIIKYTLSVDHNEYFGAMAQAVTSNADVDIYTGFHFARSRDGGNPSKIFGDTYTATGATYSTTTTQNTFVDLTVTTVDNASNVGVTGSNDGSFTSSAVGSTPVFGWYMVSGRPETSLETMQVNIGKDTGSGLDEANVTEQSGAVMRVSNARVRHFIGCYYTSLNNGQSVGVMVDNNSGGGAGKDFECLSFIHQIWSIQ